MKFKVKKWDWVYYKEVDFWWNFVHCLGSLVLVKVGRWFGMSRFWAFGIVLVAGILWEVADGFYGGKEKYLDKAGFDFRDVVSDFLGAVTGMLI